MREHWRDPGFWRSWWRFTVPLDAKIAVAFILACGLGLAGYVGARGLSGAAAGSTGEWFEVTTLKEVVTVRKQGRVVVKPRLVIRTVPAAGKPVYSTQVVLGTITTAGGERVVTRREAIPVVRRQIVTVNGQARTVVQTRAGATRTSVVTDRRTVTNDRVVTNESVVTNERVLTTERVVTVDGKPVTVTRMVTETVPVTVRSTDTVRVTTTVPVTVTAIQTQTKTDTETITQTETVPVTVTVTVPPKPPKP